MEHKVLPLISLDGHKRNYRSHPEGQLKKLTASLERFQQVRSIVVAPSANGRYTILAGHGVVEAAKLCGISDIKCDVVPEEWDQSTRDAYLVADNLHSLDAEDDQVKLAALLQAQVDAGFSLESMGTDEESLQQLLESLDGALDDDEYSECDEDEVPENVETRCKLGDLWKLGEHRLLVGDCTKSENMHKLMQGEKSDMMFTDPPYGVSYSGGGHFDEKGEYVAHKREKLANDKTTDIYIDFLPIVLPSVDGPCYMWFSDSCVRDIYNAAFNNKCEIHALIIWHKTNATYAALHAQYKQRHEPCLYFKPKGSTLRWIGPSDECTLWEIPRDAQNTLHPTQKPIALSLRAIGNHDVKVVLDVFGGSGSTLIACERARKICMMMEINPQYADIIVARWEQHTGQQAQLLDRIEDAAHV